MAAKTNYIATIDGEKHNTGYTATGAFTYDSATHVLCGRITGERFDEITFKKLELNEAFEDPLTAPAHRQDLTPAMTSAKSPLASPVEFGVVIAPNELIEALRNELTYINFQSELFDENLGVMSGGIVKAPEGSETITCAAQTKAPIIDDGGAEGPGGGPIGDGGPSGAGAGTFDSGIHDLNKDDGGCSTTGDTGFGSAGLCAAAGLGLALVMRARRRS